MAKKIFVLLIAICLLIGIVPMTSYAKSDVYVSNDPDAAEITNINPYKKVFYLPASISIDAVCLQTNTGKYSYDNITYKSFPSDRKIDLTPGKTTDKYGNTCYKIFLSSGEEYTFYSGSSIGAVYVATSGGIVNLRNDKNYRDKDSQIIITDENGKAVYSDISNDSVSEIKGRGNASFSNEKKPFQIKLGKKTDLFGMGKAKTWILLANYNDSSYIRNACAFKIANALELPYTPNSVFVDLYIDNEYQGLYQLCEKTQIGTNRVEITDLEELNEKANSGKDLDSLSINYHSRANGKDSNNLNWYKYAQGMKNPDDITGGYLVELDNLYSGAEKCTFMTNNGNVFTVKSPEVSSEDEMNYIANLFSDFEQALYSKTGYNDKGKYYTEYCDLESLVRVYVLEEITKNWDAYIGSIFFYKDTSGNSTKIYAGPVWDFDNTWGNLRRLTFNTDKEELWANGKNSGYKSDFGAAVMQHKDAQELASKLYSVAAFYLETMLGKNGFINTTTGTLEKSAAMDMMRWPVERRDPTFIYFETYSDKTVDSAVGYLRDFMTVRTEALYDSFNAEHISHVHKMIKTEEVAPTCEGSGAEEYWTCSECGKMFSDAVGVNEIDAPRTIEPTGHIWSEWTVTKEATVEEEGVEMRVCLNDGTHIETRPVPRKEPPVTEAPTKEVTGPTEPTEIATETPTSKGGCSSFVGDMGISACIASIFAAVILKKRKK